MPARHRRPAPPPPPSDAPARRTPGQRAGVTRDAVLAAATTILERDGLEHVTMRRLAAELGVAPNALYSHVPNKTALLDALLDAALADVRIPRADDGTWQEGVAAVMRASRRALLAHPQLVPLFLARPGGPNALRLGEAALHRLAQGGIDGRRAVQALRALLVYTLGFAAIEVPRIADPAGRARLVDAASAIERLPADEYPATRAVGEHLATHPGDEDFELGLAWLLAGIARAGRAGRAGER